MDDLKKDIEFYKLEFEKEKFSKEYALREREISLEEKKEKRNIWKNPLYLTILGAIVGLIGNAFVSYYNNKAGMEIEDRKAEAARILEVLKTGNPDIAAENLNFLLQTGLVKLDTNKLRDYLDSRKPGQGARLAANTDNGEVRKGSILESDSISRSSRLIKKYPQNNTGINYLTFNRQGYAFAFDTIRKLPVWALYTLSSKMLPAPGTNLRRPANKWKYDGQIPLNLQLGREFYGRSGFDLGKLVSGADNMTDLRTYTEITLFSVTLPIYHATNVGSWLKLQEATRDWALHNPDRELTIISGPVFDSQNTLYKGVKIPGKLFRIIADAKSKTFLYAWVIPNTLTFDDTTPERYLVKVTDIERLTGLNFTSILNQ